MPPLPAKKYPALRGQGFLAAHTKICLLLLPSGPDKIHSMMSHETQLRPCGTKHSIAYFRRFGKPADEKTRMIFIRHNQYCPGLRLRIAPIGAPARTCVPPHPDSRRSAPEAAGRETPRRIRRTEPRGPANRRARGTAPTPPTPERARPIRCIRRKARRASFHRRRSTRRRP